MTHRYTEMDPDDALYTVARKFPGGIGDLAQLMGTTEAVLRMKVSPKVSTHYLSRAEFSEVIKLCKEAGVKDADLPLQALNWHHGLVAFAMPSSATASEDQLALTVCRVMKEVGDVAERVSISITDGRITVEEMDSMEREFQEALSSLYQWRAKVQERYALQKWTK